MIKFASNWREFEGSSLCTPISSTNETGRHDKAEIMLKVALNTIAIT